MCSKFIFESIDILITTQNNERSNSFDYYLKIISQFNYTFLLGYLGLSRNTEFFPFSVKLITCYVKSFYTSKVILHKCVDMWRILFNLKIIIFAIKVATFTTPSIDV